MDKTIKPLGDRVVIEKKEKKEATVAGIILPESQSTGSGTNIGTVIATGDGAEKKDGTMRELRVKIGQTVVFSWGDKIEVDRKEYHIVNEGNILAIIE